MKRREEKKCKSYSQAEYSPYIILKIASSLIFLNKNKLKFFFSFFLLFVLCLETNYRLMWFYFFKWSFYCNILLLLIQKSLSVSLKLNSQ